MSTRKESGSSSSSNSDRGRKGGSTGTIHKRTDVNPERGEHEYGDVAFADPVNKKYPIDTEEHIRAAHSYINHKDNAAKYSPDEVTAIKARINAAAKKHGIEINTD